MLTLRLLLRCFNDDFINKTHKIISTLQEIHVYILKLIIIVCLYKLSIYWAINQVEDKYILQNYRQLVVQRVAEHALRILDGTVFFCDPAQYNTDNQFWNLELNKSLQLGLLTNQTLMNDEFAMTLSYRLHCQVTIHYDQLHFIQRNNYLWTCSSLTSPTHQAFPFGKFEQILDHFDISSVPRLSYKMHVPANMEYFKWMLDQSRYVTCNSTAKGILLEKFPEYAPNKEFTKNQALPSLLAFKNVIDSLQVRVFLAGGTLLGWYRQCDVFEQSLDIDFAILAEEYSSRIETVFKGHPDIYMYIRYGNETNTEEIRLWAVKGQLYVDLFLESKIAEGNKRACLNQINCDRYRHLYPIFTEFCSTDLLVGVHYTKDF
ncbi:hypothetical protein GJ496_002812 [Pomphorhynchus laevis]|nr:hypothetical protein GJ496_002812 [Pomphorhynchus laevis]